MSLGTHSLTATYSGDANNSASTSAPVSHTVNAAVVLNVSPNPVGVGSAFVATVTLTGTSPTGTVTFKDGAATLGTGTIAAGMATLSASLATAGLHSLSASYAGDANNPANTSAPFMLQVGANPALVSPGEMSTLLEYDANGNQTRKTDALGNVSAMAYDSLDRLASVTAPADSAGAMPGVSLITRDGADNITQFKDPRSVSTSYTVDGLGRTRAVASPDAGTASYTFDVMGQPLTQTDARGKVTTMAYDTQHRLKQLSFQTGVATTFEYDGGASPTPLASGELTRVTDESGSTSYAYDTLGRVTAKSVLIGTKTFNVAYTYGTSGTAAGKLTAIRYPSGTVVNYLYDGAGGKLSAITYNAVNANGVGVQAGAVNVLTGISHNPLGAVLGWSWSGGAANARTYDAYGRLSSYQLGNPAGAGMAAGVKRTLGYDAAGMPVSFTHTGSAGAQASLDQAFGYDGLSRVVSAQVGTTSYGYDYDLSGNRTSRIVGGANLVQTIAPASNRLTQAQAPGPVTQPIAYDASGNVLSDASYTYAYSSRGRMSSVATAGGTVSYLYNGMELRASKTGPVAVVPTGAAYFVYAEDGALLGEYDAAGAPVYETVYLGSMPVGVLKTSGTAGASSLAVAGYNVYADHLDTPRVVTRQSDEAIVWRWDGAEPYGATAANQNPGGLGAFVFNQRFPGQVFDAETGLLQNWHREYNPRLGRYMQSDPIGLKGGINTYEYVSGNPLSGYDPTGLFDPTGFYPAIPAVGAAAGAAAGTAAGALGAAAVVSVGIGIGINKTWEYVTGQSFGGSVYDALHPTSDPVLQKEIEKGANQSEVHRICDEQPPPNLDPCQLARWNLTKQLRCKMARNALSDKWFGGPDKAHIDHIKNNVDPAIERMRRAVDKICKPCP